MSRAIISGMLSALAFGACCVLILNSAAADEQDGSQSHPGEKQDGQMAGGPQLPEELSDQGQLDEELMSKQEADIVRFVLFPLATAASMLLAALSGCLLLSGEPRIISSSSSSSSSASARDQSIADHRVVVSVMVNQPHQQETNHSTVLYK